MLKKIYEEPNIFQIDVPLPDNPLKNLNCYIIQDKGETLIVDTGFNRPECEEALLAGLKELDANWNRTDLFLTHLHSDHTGLAPVVMEGKPGKIYISAIDHDILAQHKDGHRWAAADELYYKEGFTREQLAELRISNPARGLAPAKYFDAVHVADGDEIRVGRWVFTCVFVPGHTPGQMCLYCKEKKLMFTADHILFDITPNITHWAEAEDSLGDYLDSLVKIRSYEMETAFPAHRKNEMDVYVRIAQIIEHHLVRMQETVEALSAHPNSHATEIAAHLKWSMRGKTWAEFPLSQRWFAVGETMAHLDFLVVRGMAEKTEGERNAYRLLLSAEACNQKLEEIWEKYR
ncbi:MAG: MBL fold metallo-hydrolase [Bacillota bacterium]|nr:MBL fold metallo-hydrolase [Bacillota bacterium]